MVFFLLEACLCRLSKVTNVIFTVNKHIISLIRRTCALPSSTDLPYVVNGQYFIYLFSELKVKIARTNNVNNVNNRLHEDKSKNHDEETLNCDLLAIYTFLVSVFCSTAIDNKNKCDGLSCGKHLVLLISNDINCPSLNEIEHTNVGQHN